MTDFGLLVVDKPVGPTSHQVVHIVRKGTGIRKVGHAGTLDPRASGVLVLCLGAATRLSEYLSASDKVYQAVVRFGEATSTFDSDGEVTTAGGLVPALEFIERTMPAFRGRIEQAPPPFSAVKIQGKKAYQLARRGEMPVLEPRPIEIRRLEILDYQPPDLSLEVECSAGTYIRTLADDLGRAVGSGAHLRALRRISSGHFRIEDAISLAELERTFAEARGDGGGGSGWRRHLRSPSEALRGMPIVDVDPAQIDLLRRGRPLPDGEPCFGLALAVDGEGQLIAILRAASDGRSWHPHKVFFP